MFKGVVFLACLVTCCSAQVPCHAGFFGSKGQKCRECPHNTYKDYIGFASSCKPCPVNSGHNLLGSHIFSDCKCLKGYSGDPMQDIPCTIRLCDPFAPPINGSLVGVCNSEYNSVCRIKCNEGYELEGGSAHAERKCIVNKNNHMEWTGGLPYCSPIRCPLVNVSNANPPSGVCSSAPYVPRYKTRCSFKCDLGYRLKGSKERVCQLDKTWSGIPTICEAIYCPKLSPVKFATVQPPECVTQPMKFHSMCRFRCPDGYFTDDELHDTKAYLGCQHNGTWNAQVPMNCVDRQPPRISCPLSKIRGVTTKGKATGNVSWSIKVTDNSEMVDPNAKITVDSSHQPSQEFPIGKTVVRIIATDSAGNVNSECIFDVEIGDNEPPTFSKCPKDIVREEKVSSIRVNWDLPVFYDNSGVLPSVSSSLQSGATFLVPGNYKNTYTAEDRSGNENKNCTFRIILKKKTCQIFPPPRNGALVCMTSEFYLYCAVMCSSGTDFEDTPPLLYKCDGGEWNYWRGWLPRYKNSNPWPNCSFNAGPSEMKKLNLTYYFYNGDAHDANVQNNLKENFFKLLKDPFFVLPFFCKEKHQCTKDKISVSAGVVG